MFGLFFYREFDKALSTLAPPAIPAKMKGFASPPTMGLSVIAPEPNLLDFSVKKVS